MNNTKRLFFVLASVITICISAFSVFADEVNVHFVDIGQGDCELIESDGEYMLIDAGDTDKGDEVIAYLKSQNVTKLKYIIATHPHADHIGGMADVINEYGADNFITTSKTATTKCYENMLKAISNKGMKITTPMFGDTYALGSATFEIITPNDGTDMGSNINDYSVGIKLTCGNTAFVMCGDAESDTEKKIVDSGANISANVLKCGHHGSSTSSSKEFLNAVNPQYAIISCGENNKYGHPHKETIEKLDNLGIQYFRTDEQGTIVAHSDGESVSFPRAGSAGRSVNEKLDTPVTGMDTQSAVQQLTDGARAYLKVKTATLVLTQSETYILNTNSKKFHRQSCDSVSKMSAKNKEISNKSRDEIISMGYEPCKNCNP